MRGGSHAKQTTNANEGLMATNAFLALGCLAWQSQCKTVASGSNSGTSVFVGVLTIDLHPANKPNTSVEPFPHTRTCEAHATVIKGTALAPCGQRLHPSVDRRAPVCWCNHGKHTGARRPTLGCKVSIRTTNVVPWWRACMRLASFRAERLCKVHVRVVRRAQVCCEDPHKQTSARVGTTRGGSHAKQTAIAY
jgi:hypothetical protein